ncbi:MAG: FGGY-family carbohydrate kinase [Solirubrobacteraceae bacterium]
MSLLGLDVGSSRVKANVYRDDGRPLVRHHRALRAIHARPGWWELAPDDVLAAVTECLTALVASPRVRRDPIRAVAISASGREIFPVDRSGRPLGPCIMAADTRGAECAQLIAKSATDGDWLERCGHVPGRMDPINRVLWWQRHRPETAQSAHRFLGWHEFLALRMAGTAVTDPSLAAQWLAYDLSRAEWSVDRVGELGIDPGLLPEIRPWGSAIGAVSSKFLPNRPILAVGGFDAICAAMGTGAIEPGACALVSGSWEDVIAPIPQLPQSDGVAASGFSVSPYPSSGALALVGLNPNGGVVIDWIRRLMRFSWTRLENELAALDRPGPVVAVPHLSASTCPFGNIPHSRGAFLGATLATQSVDLVRAVLEGVALEFAVMLDRLAEYGTPTHLVRATGGGTRFPWWMQLKADLGGVPIEVTDSESGAFAAAILAGVTVGAFPSLTQALRTSVVSTARYEPVEARAKLYAERRGLYLELVQATAASEPPRGDAQGCSENELSTYFAMTDVLRDARP